ncbi:MAG: hypothetical protein ABL925_15785, partial [Methylococcales bacterium]
AINTVDTGLGIPLTPDYTPIFIETVYLSDTIDSTKATVRVTTSNNYLGKITSDYVGKVTSTPSGINNCGTTSKKATCTTTKPKSTAQKRNIIRLKASPAPNYVFTGWRGDCKGYKATISLDLKINHNCTATFAKAVP